MGCHCLQGLSSLFRVPCDYEEERANFERTLEFLTSVPLFRKQLPRSELPKVAQNLQRKVWQPGQRLVRQAETGRAFFLIYSGEASVITESTGPGDPERTRATLHAGDHFGGHTLTTDRPNVATIIASGSALLVTLSMSRTAFEETGLRRWLHFPKRPAIYEGAAAVLSPRYGAEDSSFQVGTLEKPVEEEFIRSAVSRNVNLRALLQASADKLAGITVAAQRREVPQGTVVATCGEVGHEFFVIREGSFYVDIQLEPAARGGESAEAVVARSTMADRLLRKHTFLQELTMTPSRSPNKAASMALLGRSEVQKREPEKMSLTNMFRGRHSLSRRTSRQPRQGVDRFDMDMCEAWSNPSETPGNGRRATRCNTTELSLNAAQEPRLVEEAHYHVLTAGESFGELSLLYNTRREATFTAAEDSVVYVVGRRQFKDCFSRRDARFQDYCQLLEEVRMLAPLLSTERWELACSATGLIQFPPEHRILTQGVPRQARQWYVVYSGSCIMSRQMKGEDGQIRLTRLAEVRRAGTFGERSLLRGDEVPQVHVDAGPEGLCCLIFDFEMVRVLIEGVLREGDGTMPTVHCDVADWCSWKAHGGWERQVSSAGGRLTSKEGRFLDLSSLRKICVLGRGGYGQVSLVEDYSKRRYALKILSKGYIQNQGTERLVRWERELLSMVRSTFIIRLFNSFSDEQHVYLLLEAALGGSLMQVIQHHPEVLQEDTPHGFAAAFYVACLTEALEHLHERRIVHRDLKPENVLLDERGYAKLCDMGFARFVLGKTNTLAGTPEYMAPEMIDFPHTHDVAVDWWALGVMTYELLTGQTPFNDEGISDPMGRLLALRRSQEKGTPTFPMHFPHAARGFVAKLLQKVPHRLGATHGAAEIRAHGMFTALKLDWEALADLLIPSPFSQEWTNPAHYAADDLGMERGELGLSEDDPLFAPVCGEGGWHDF